MVAAVAGAVDAGSAVQRVHAEAGIVGDGGQAAGLADGLGLDEGIGLKGSAGLVRLDGDAKLLLADHFVALSLEDAPQLAELSGVAGGCTNSHWGYSLSMSAAPCPWQRSTTFCAIAGFQQSAQSCPTCQWCFAPGLRLPASASLSLASCWPRPQQLLPVSAAGGGRRRCPY